MSEHKHGEMDVSVHEETFSGFLKWTRIVVILSILVLVFLAVFNS